MPHRYIVKSESFPMLLRKPGEEFVKSSKIKAADVRIVIFSDIIAIVKDSKDATIADRFSWPIGLTWVETECSFFIIIIIYFILNY